MTAMDEIRQLRQSPGAYLLLAYCRQICLGRDSFRFRPYRVAADLCRSPRTVRTALDVLVDRGFLAKTPHRQIYELTGVSRETV